MNEKQKQKEARFLTDFFGIKTSVVKPNISQTAANSDSYSDDQTIAFSELLGIEYDMVRGLEINYLKSLGLSDLHSTEILVSFCNAFGLEKLPITSKSNITVCEFMNEHKTGKYIIISTYHAFCYMDGVWYDREESFQSADEMLISDVIAVFKKGKQDEKIITHKCKRYLVNQLGINYKLGKFSMKEMSRLYDMDEGNCTTFAFSKLMGIPYYKVRDLQLDIMRETGSCAFHWKILVNYLAKYKFGLTHVTNHYSEGMNVARFMLENQTGNYIIIADNNDFNHAFCYKDGVWIEQSSSFNELDKYLSGIIYDVWKKD